MCLQCVWEREREMETNRESQRVQVRAMSNIWDWGSGGFSVYFADVLMVPAGIDTAKTTKCVCCDCVCEWGLHSQKCLCM